MQHVSDDTEFNEAYGWDGYDFMEVARNNWWRALAEIGEWPYSVFYVKWNELLNYIEGDLVYYEVKSI